MKAILCKQMAKYHVNNNMIYASNVTHFTENVYLPVDMIHIEEKVVVSVNKPT